MIGMTLKMQPNSFALIVASATMLAAAFFLPEQAGFLVFLFLIPLFYGAFLGLRFGFMQGFAWGLLFFALHWWGLVLVFIERAEGEWRMAAPLFLILYCAFYAGLWFACAGRCMQKFSCNLGRAICWSGVTIAYFIILHAGIFWIFGSLRGYFFALPILPLGIDPRFLGMLSHVGSYGLLSCLIIGQALIAYTLVHGVTQKRALCAALAWLPFGYGWVSRPAEQPEPRYLEVLGYVQPPKKRDHPLDCAQVINKGLEKLCMARPAVRCILMPESSLPFPLDELPNIVELWAVNALTNGQTLLIGTQLQNEGNLHNVVLCIQERQIISCYVKNELFWFTEYVPFPWSCCASLRKLFLKNNKGFSPIGKCSLPVELLQGFTCRVAVCSELFFNTYPRGPQPLLAVVNDGWFSARYLRNLMFLFARFSAIEKHQEIIYVGHEAGTWIGRNGKLVDI